MFDYRMICRGKKVNGGEWVYGYYAGDDTIVVRDKAGTARMKVRHETLGQAVVWDDELADLTGKPILYEGDIIPLNGILCEVLFDPKQGGFALRQLTSGYRIPVNTLLMLGPMAISVLGNIYDSPYKEFYEEAEK